MVISGGLEARKACASASAILRIASMICCWTIVLCVRMLRPMWASSGMTLCFTPALTNPTVMIAGTSPASSRERIVCNFITNEEAITTGSIVSCGEEPCPPLPNSLTSTSIDANMITPELCPTIPEASGKTCWPRHMSGRGNLVNSPSRSIALAPCPVSSAGWPQINTVPHHVSRSLARISAVAIKGSASMSPRSITTGPAPLRKRPTTPVCPTPSVTS
ncbi:MAG: hypothetical protein WBQ25_02025 [Nitrososphaeraceae archaeon]